MTMNIIDSYFRAGTVRLMNSAMMPGEGRYTNRQISPEKFRALMCLADYEGKLISYIGYEATVQVLREFTGLTPELNRRLTDLEDGDLLLCVRLKYRVQDPRMKRHEKPSLADYEFFACRYEATVEPE